MCVEMSSSFVKRLYTLRCVSRVLIGPMDVSKRQRKYTGNVQTLFDV